MLPNESLIAVVAPAGIFKIENVTQGMQVLQSWGYRTVEAPNLHAKHLFTAGTAEQRRSDFLWALKNPDIKAIYFARGGYGTSHILEALPFHDYPEKPVFGYSDATALACGLQCHQKGTFVHSPVLNSLKNYCDDATKDALKNLLQNGTVPSLSGQQLCGHSETTIEAEVFGGNLCVIASLIGTPWQPKLDGHILLLEDLSEPPYKVHRLLTQLQMGGLFNNVAAIGLGEFLNCDPPAHLSWSLKDCFVRFFRPLDIPIIWNLPFGHGKRNIPWIQGQKYRLSKGSLDVV